MSLVEVDTAQTPKTMTEIFSYLENEKSLEINRVTENYYSISFKPSEKRLIISDAEDDEYLSGLYAAVQINGETVPTSGLITDGALTFLYKPRHADSIVLYVPGYTPLILSQKSLINNEVSGISSATSYSLTQSAGS